MARDTLRAGPVAGWSVLPFGAHFAVAGGVRRRVIREAGAGADGRTSAIPAGDILAQLDCTRTLPLAAFARIARITGTGAVTDEGVAADAVTGTRNFFSTVTPTKAAVDAIVRW